MTSLDPPSCIRYLGFHQEITSFLKGQEIPNINATSRQIAYPEFLQSDEENWKKYKIMSKSDFSPTYMKFAVAMVTSKFIVNN